MAVVNSLPNGYLVVTLSPREAVMLMDQILDPGDYPWQSTEHQVVGMEVKAQLKGYFDQTNASKMFAVAQMADESQRENAHDEDDD